MSIERGETQHSQPDAGPEVAATGGNRYFGVSALSLLSVLFAVYPPLARSPSSNGSRLRRRGPDAPRPASPLKAPDVSASAANFTVRLPDP